MDESKLQKLVEDAFGDAAHVIQTVGKRGLLEVEQECDDFGELLLRREFRDAVVAELYEEYFLPKRHEFDWQVLHQIVSIVTSEPIQEYFAMAVVSGVVGNAAWAALRLLLRRVATEMKCANISTSRRGVYLAIESDVAEVERFFGEVSCARIASIEDATRVDRARLYPLLKLLGFKHHRRAHACYWCRPGGSPPEAQKHG